MLPIPQILWIKRFFLKFMSHFCSIVVFLQTNLCSFSQHKITFSRKRPSVTANTDVETLFVFDFIALFISFNMNTAWAGCYC